MLEVTCAGLQASNGFELAAQSRKIIGYSRPSKTDVAAALQRPVDFFNVTQWEFLTAPRVHSVQQGLLCTRPRILSAFKIPNDICHEFFWSANGERLIRGLLDAKTRHLLNGFGSCRKNLPIPQVFDQGIQVLVF